MFIYGYHSVYVFCYQTCCKDLAMSSTSQKHRNFIAEPMGEKPVSDLAGIGDVLGGRLTDLGYDKVAFLMHFA